MMPSNLQPSKKYLDSAADMNLESRQQQNSKVRVPSRQENQNLKHQGKLKVKASVDSPCTYLRRELRKEADGKILVQPKPSGNHQSQYPKGKAIKEDELVKYMSKLPGYLKLMEGGKNVQDKALTVGVLDWARLEEWKCDHKYYIAMGNNNVSAIKPCTFSSVTQGRTRAHQSEQPLSLHSLNSSKKDGLPRGVKPSSQKALHFQDFETSSKRNLGGQRKMPWTNKSFDRNNADVTLRKGKTRDCDEKLTSEMGSLSTDLGKCGVAISPKAKVSSWDREVEAAQVSCKNRKDLDDKTFAVMGTSYPKSRSLGVSLGSMEKICDGNVETKERTEKLKESNIDLGHQHLPGLENIVLLLPKDLYQNSSPKEFGVARDENLVEANQNRFSTGSFSPVKSCSAELSSDIPHLCPLSSEVENKLKTNLMAHRLINSQHAELSYDASNSSPYSGASSAMLSDCEDAEQNTIQHMNANADENLKLLDQEMAEMAVIRFRNPSPSRRFSFSLSRMGRSFSWKESSGVPQMSLSYVSVKSGPVKSEAVSRLDDYSRQKTNGHDRARSSPLRRILEPLLRSRSSNRGHAAEAVPPFEGNSSELNFRPVVDSTSPPNKMHEASTTQALLQLTMKNGLPLFKFVVENNSCVLAATVKNLTSGKDDSGQSYTVYSVNEIKKKGGGWISQGSKQKSCSFVNNVIGQMVSSSNFSNPKSQNLKNQYMVRESVLFGVELKQVDQASPKLPNKELAAVVVKMPIGSFRNDAEQRDNDTTEKGFTECFLRSYSSEGNKNSCSTTVILPSGIHGLPDKGMPSPLIERWKSGGLCDCGGWDVGCKLRTLANRSQMTSISCSNSNSFELFEGDQQNMPIFNLVPLNNEIYSVEFNSSMFSLQAFFISVTVITSQKSYEAEVFQEEPVMNESGTKKSSLTNIVFGKMPAKYAHNPPQSPVGRV